MSLPAMSEISCISTGPAHSVAVVGGGISGLAAAYKLKSNGLSVTVFETEERPGGKIRSRSQDGFIWDEGANTMTESEMCVGKLIDDLGLREMQQFPISQGKRYISRNGIPEMVPSNPMALMSSKFLSTKSKLQVVLEPFIWKKTAAKVSDVYSEESVGHFFQRHFGKEVVDFVIDPILAGSSAGDPESLSMRHVFPEIWDLEKKYGSVLIGAIWSKILSKKGKNVANKTTGKEKVQHGSFSFQGGMQTLVDKLCSQLDDESLKLRSKVLSLSYYNDEISHKWSISYSSHLDNQKQQFLDQSFDAVIMTAPINIVQDMEFKKGGHPFILDFLPKVNYLPLSVLVTSFKKRNVKRPLEGFGVLVPSREQENGLKTLGTLFSSMMFPDRAPSDQHLYTTFIGGSRNRELAGASLDELKQVVISDLQRLLGVEGHPTFVKHFQWKNAFPLYGYDYGLVLDGINKMEETLPGFFYAGNHRDGLAVGKAIASGCKAAEHVVTYLCSSTNKNMK
ncbi:Protoporphyrinogen oxidase 2 [Zostera marina]|uniref:Protoporphyrinogen oxidase n=1 Tax=Zostera marina TaxID=29655 RepID=A0A0K9PTR4_ZOSMR|nr:Protoporphyrinogen oxidase 2 [Zostera marina]